MELLQTIWGYVLPIGGGLTIGAVIVAIGGFLLKNLLGKKIKEIDVDKITENATEKGIEKIKSVSFSQDIAPLVKSELVKVSETITSELGVDLANIQTEYQNLVACLECLSAYFDDSIISTEKKTALKEAIEKAKEGKTESATINVSVDEKSAEKSVLDTVETKVVR